MQICECIFPSITPLGIHPTKGKYEEAKARIFLKVLY